ncbi:MFS transporter [Natrarchaeobaculum aegyptiacum]|uniref:MFS transporter n=1 Tax=Natrarchaeobaculum aegyptiacum TaxID=745377 RepID=A0A2Z2I0T1_9EURY|nr:MFS transporter [Natrarchaeobaculum aegyptiacum]ARS89848.1 MFS transporter [Natrarchaeobaculum aegyptiacum]
MHPTDRDRIVLAAVVFTVLFSQLLLYPGIATLVEALGADADAGTSPFAATELDASMWFLVAEFVGYVTFVGIWGVLSDVTGRRTPFVVAGALAGAVGYATLAVVPAIGSLSFDAVLVVRFFQGAMTIGAFSLTITMLMDLEGGHGRNMGAAGIAIGLGAALGAPIGGQLTGLSPVAPLFAAAALLVVVGTLVATLEDRAPETRRTPRALLEGVRRRPTLSIPYAFGFVDRMTAGFFALVGTLYFQATFGVDAATTGLLLACFFAPFALLQYPLGMLSDRIGRTIPIVVGSLCYGGGILLVGAAPSVLTAALAMILVGVLGALVSPATMALVTDLADDRERGVAMAGFNVAGSLGFLGGFLVGGVVAGRYGYDPAFLVVGGLEIAIAVVAVPAFLKLGLESSDAVERGDPNA